MNCRLCITIALIGLLQSTAGCWYRRQEFRFPEHQVGPHEAIATQIEYPDVEATIDPDLASSTAPRTTENPRDQEAMDISLAEAMRLAFASSDVIRNLGGSVVPGPAGTTTMFNPAIIESDPRTSVEAALSAFDAQLTSALFWNKIQPACQPTLPTRSHGTDHTLAAANDEQLPDRTGQDGCHGFPLCSATSRHV